jgi:hypothetical protein
MSPYGSLPLTAADADSLLAGRAVRSGVPAVQHALAVLLDSAAGPPSDQELAGEVAAVAAFMLVTSQRDVRRQTRFRTLARRGQAVAAVVGTSFALAFSGAAAASALPAPIQELAHKTFGAPAPRHSVLAPGKARGKAKGHTVPPGHAKH